MPGIVGMISKRPAIECLALVQSMVGSMERESFYCSGMHFVPEMGIYAGWIALEDSFAADQVFFNEQRTVALLFSGECFLDASARAQLRRKGHEFESDRADWLVHLYEEEGERLFEKLNGLFSGLLIDRRLRKAFLFNDRYGIERIYFHETQDELYFASEAKALLRVLPELRTFDEEGVTQFLAFGCTLATRTLFRGIQVLPGGSLWSFEAGECRKRQYFSPETWESQPVLPAESFLSRFEQTFKRVLPRYFELNSPIGIALTAGLDTRMIMACLPATELKPLSYTFSGQDRDTLDAKLAARVAATCSLEHHILRIGPDFFSEFDALADRTVCNTDGCLGILGAHETYMNAQARQLAPLRLTGNYGSEVLRGVRRFKPLGLSPRLVNPELANAVNSRAQGLAGAKEHPVTFAAFREIPRNRFGVLAAGRSQLAFRTPYLDNEIVRLAYQAPESLRTSAVPAVRLIQTNNPALREIPTTMGQMVESAGAAAAAKRWLCKATFRLDYLYNEGLPHWLSRTDALFRDVASCLGILGLHKHLHYRSWFRRELASYTSAILTDPQTARSQFWNRDFLAQLADKHVRGRRNYVLEINAVLTLEAVERLLFRELGRHPESRNRPDITAAPALSR